MLYRYALSVVAIVILASASITHAEPRPFIFGSGHYLSVWQEPARPSSYDSDCMAKIVEMGGTSVWIDFPWASMEEVEGTIDWTYADAQVAMAESHGLEMFAYTGTTPDWAKLYSELPGHRTPASENHIQQFVDFHTALAQRYAGRVKYYQFWNEPSGCSWINDCSNGDGYELFTLWLGRWYQAMKAADPECVLSAAGLDGYPPPYVQGMYDYIAANGGGEYFDAISVHPYGNPMDYNAVSDTYSVMAANGDSHKKIWITEWGYSTSGTSLEQQAANVTAVLETLKQPTYDYVFYAKYLIINDGWNLPMGLMDIDLNPKPAWYAFRDVDKTFPDAYSPTVLNPSFEEADGALHGWHVSLLSDEGPDLPALTNANPYGPQTPFGDRFAGKVTGWLKMNFRLGQIMEVTQTDPSASVWHCDLSAHVQMHSRHSDGSQRPGNVHQVWEIGWNDDGSLPTGLDGCDNYQTVADIDGNYTGNDLSDFYPLAGTSTIVGVSDLRYVVFRVHMYSDAGVEWTMNHVDQIEFSVRLPLSSPDLNSDNHVDAQDYAMFASCMTGSAVEPELAACFDADFDHDADVDVSDFGILQRCYTGPLTGYDATCLGE